jgi:hypothetical protein
MDWLAFMEMGLLRMGGRIYQDEGCDGIRGYIRYDGRRMVLKRHVYCLQQWSSCPGRAIIEAFQITSHKTRYIVERGLEY